MKDYIVATIKPWNIAAFRRHAPTLEGRWYLATDAVELAALLKRLTARYVFFPHWSSIVPEDILNKAECVCFHMADVPYGRGGSPLQNLIGRGHTDTLLTALRMVKELDAGPVYLKRHLSLAGRAQDIFERMADLVYEMIGEIVRTEPKPVPQQGEVTTFRRRTPEMSILPEHGTVKELYDHIRMLDAETYPLAFLEHGDFRIEFTGAEIVGDTVRAQVVIATKPR